MSTSAATAVTTVNSATTFSITGGTVALNRVAASGNVVFQNNGRSAVSGDAALTINGSNAGGAYEFTNTGSFSVAGTAVVTLIDDYTQTGGTASTTMTGGTFKVGGEWFSTSGTSVNATNGLVEFTNAGNHGNTESFLGSLQFDDVQVDSGAVPAFSGTTGANIKIAGNFTNNGTAAFTTTGNTVTFNGSTPQSVGSTTSATFNQVVVSNTGSTVTLGVNESVSTSLNISSGTLDLNGFTFNRASSGSGLTVANGATLKIGGTQGFPANSSSPQPRCIEHQVEYSSTNQTVANQSYGNLTLSGSGTKTMPATTLAIAGNFTTAGTPATTAQGAINVNGNVVLNGGTFNAGSFTHTVKGNWTNGGGTFNAGTGKVTFNGSSLQTVTGGPTFNNLEVNGGGLSLASGNLTLGASGVLTLTSGLVTTGTNTVVVNNTASGGVTGASSTSYVSGTLARVRCLPAGGDAQLRRGRGRLHAQATVAFANIGTGGTLAGGLDRGRPRLDRCEWPRSR